MDKQSEDKVMITGPNKKKYRDIDSYIQDLVRIAYNLGLDKGAAKAYAYAYNDDYDNANAECDKDNAKFTETFGYELE
jgi:outer membrane murein-binding lipoprotein Lpp